MTLEQVLGSDWMVFTDLDGTLLDHHDYAVEAARPALARLMGAGIPLVPCSSKTLVEIREIGLGSGADGPIIAENGALVAYPKCWPGSSGALQRFSPAYGELVALLDSLRRRHGLRFRGFHDLGPQGVAQLTGLGRGQGALACRREGSEPILWEDSESALDTFAGELATHGLKLLRGGRFVHVLGVQADKAHAVKTLIATLRQEGWEGQSIALGDAPNDHAMLCAVDIPVIVRNPDSPAMPPVPNPRLIRTAGTGPEGWREAIESILTEPEGKG